MPESTTTEPTMPATPLFAHAAGNILPALSNPIAHPIVNEDGTSLYLVVIADEGTYCSCPATTTCKHIRKVRRHIAATITLTTTERVTAIEWIRDCSWRDAEDDPEFEDTLTDEQIVNGIDRHYEGGWRQLLVDAGLREHREPRTLPAAITRI
jgi:hypothetical protein